MKAARIALIGILAVVIAHGQAPRISKIASTNSQSTYIGVMVQEIDGERAKALKLREEAGVEITRVEPESPAEKAGLKTGDAIVQYNRQNVEGLEQFSRLVRETPPGREVKLDVVRNGAPQNVTVKVGARRTQLSLMAPVPPLPPELPNGERFELHMPDMPHSFMSWRSAALGIECESLEGQLAQYFGVKEGVLIRSVLKASSAEKAGIRAGDVIVRVNDAKVATPADVSGHIRALQAKQVSIVLMREHKEITLSVAIDGDDQAQWRRVTLVLV